MATKQMESSAELKMEVSTLYREELFPDRRIGTIRRLTPVTADGVPDEKRKVEYIGEAQIMTPAGALPINFEIDATSLTEAAENFGVHAKEAIERAVKEIQEMRRQAGSSIVVPGAGGIPGASKLQLP